MKCRADIKEKVSKSLDSFPGTGVDRRNTKNRVEKVLARLSTRISLFFVRCIFILFLVFPYFVSVTVLIGVTGEHPARLTVPRPPIIMVMMMMMISFSMIMIITWSFLGSLFLLLVLCCCCCCCFSLETVALCHTS